MPLSTSSVHMCAYYKSWGETRNQGLKVQNNDYIFFTCRLTKLNEFTMLMNLKVSILFPSPPILLNWELKNCHYLFYYRII